MAGPSDESGYVNARGVSGFQPEQSGQPEAPLEDEDLARRLGPPAPGKRSTGDGYRVASVVIGCFIIAAGVLLAGMGIFLYALSGPLAEGWSGVEPWATLMIWFGGICIVIGIIVIALVGICFVGGASRTSRDGTP